MKYLGDFVFVAAITDARGCLLALAVKADTFGANGAVYLKRGGERSHVKRRKNKHRDDSN